MQNGITLNDLMSMRWDRNAAIIVARFLEESGGLMLGTIGATRIKRFRFVNAGSTALLEEAPSSGSVVGVLDEGGDPGAQVRVRIGGRAVVYPSTEIAVNDNLVAVAGGYAAPNREAVFGMASAVIGADASDDILQTNLPDQVSVICAGDETGNTVVVWGLVDSVITKETIALGAAGTYTSVATFAAIYVLQTTATSVDTIDIKDATLTGLLIPQIAGSVAARLYGAVVPDDSTDAKGLESQIKAGGTNTSDVLIIGTDFNGVEQTEVVTMTSAVYADCLKAYRTVDYVGIGADGIVFDLGVTSQYTMQAPVTTERTVRGIAQAAQATVGGTVELVLNPQASWQSDGASKMVLASRFTTAGGAATESFTLVGVLATDAILVTINVKGTTPVTVVAADYSAANTVDVEFSADPSTDHQITIAVFRP